MSRALNINFNDASYGTAWHSFGHLYRDQADNTLRIGYLQEPSYGQPNSNPKCLAVRVFSAYNNDPNALFYKIEQAVKDLDGIQVLRDPARSEVGMQNMIITTEYHGQTERFMSLVKTLDNMGFEAGYIDDPLPLTQGAEWELRAYWQAFGLAEPQKKLRWPGLEA